ncbi:MAG: PIN domain-containing protein [Candidatus Thorarchaeota archaeon]|nr:PIN domain-containing protein [Candidatus Thorarchaeota archaeon]
MKSKKHETVVLDAGVLIALALGEGFASALSERIAKAEANYVCTEIALCELSYILCRRLSWKKAWGKIESLIKSSAVNVIPSSFLWMNAAKIKCDAPIALPDCFTLAAGQITGGAIYFARKERELLDAVRKGQIKENFQFLE